MGGNFKLDKAHNGVPDHLDHIQYFEDGAIKERYDKNGKLLDTRFQPSNSFAEKLKIDKTNYKIPSS